MALINCSECKKEISRQAKTCPNCGATGPAGKYGWGWVGLIFIVFAVLSQLYIPPEKKSNFKSDLQEETNLTSEKPQTEFDKKLKEVNQEGKQLVNKFLDEVKENWPKK